MLSLAFFQCTTPTPDDPISISRLTAVKTSRFAADPDTVAVPPTDSLQQYFIEDYDSVGKVVKVTYYSADGEPQAIFENEYQHNLKVANTFKGEDGTIYSKNQFSYDDSGREIESKSFSVGGEQTGQQRRRYREDGRIMEAIAVDTTGAQWRYATYYYDDQDREIQLDEYSEDGELIAVVRSVYGKENENGDWLECFKYINDTLRSVEVREYIYVVDEE